MGKRNKERGVPDAEKHAELYKMAKRQSHGGARPLVESLTNPGCMVTPKVRKAQESRRRR
jgi:hypothetical protein